MKRDSKQPFSLSKRLTYAYDFPLHFIAKVKVKKEEEKSLYELEMKNAYYMEKLQAQEQVKELYHDLKNHLLYAEKEELGVALHEKIKCYETVIANVNTYHNIFQLSFMR